MCDFEICVRFLFALCLGEGFSFIFMGQGDVLESHLFGESGQEILISYMEPGELLFFFF